LPYGLPLPPAFAAIEKGCPLRVLHLPKQITGIGAVDIYSIHPGGLLYLPNPYVVPGGMFNEMYGWDSYFIIRGLLKDGQLGLARGMGKNFFFEIDHYGGVLNANRGYYLTRSQPPFLTSIILTVYEHNQDVRVRGSTPTVEEINACC
jgi:alpha,alpha-trehalase